MTAIRGYVAPTTETDALGVHSLDQFVLAVPDASVAQNFYGNFGLDVRRDGNVLAIKTFGHDHRWGSVVEGVKTKALNHLSFGCYADDLPRLKARIEDQGVKLIDPPPGFESNGFWFRNHEGVLIELKVGPKVSPDRKSESQWVSVPAGKPGASTRAEAPPVRPRRLSHGRGRCEEFCGHVVGGFCRSGWHAEGDHRQDSRCHASPAVRGRVRRSFWRSPAGSEPNHISDPPKTFFEATRGN